jgi:hypothetical protein
MGRALEFYTNEYGAPAFGTRFIIAQTDDETMETYTGPGMLFLASKLFDSPRGCFRGTDATKLLISGGARPSA